MKLRTFRGALFRTVCKILFICFSGIAAGGFFSLAAAEGKTTVEKAAARSVDAKLIHNLSKFVEWPEKAFSDMEKQPHFFVCLLGTEDFSADFIALEKRRFRRKAVKLRGLFEGVPEQAPVCHILFIADTMNEDDIRSALLLFSRQAVLSVSNKAGFTDFGGMIGVYQSGERVRFEINIQAVKQNGLVVRAPLLELAKIVGISP